MKIDLDKIERQATVAKEFGYGTWARARIGGPVPCEVRDCDTETGEFDVVAMCPHEPDADHIANCSPDVVLALVARIRELESRYEGEHADDCVGRILGYWNCDCRESE